MSNNCDKMKGRDKDEAQVCLINQFGGLCPYTTIGAKKNCRFYKSKGETNGKGS